MAHELPELPYAKDALEPHISAETLDFHHDKHHAAYVNNLNNLVPGTEFENMSLGDIVKNAPAGGIFNNAAQVWNHTFYFAGMGSGCGGEPTGAVADVIDSTFGSFDEFKEKFSKSAATNFGSGWTWLVKNAAGGLPAADHRRVGTRLLRGQAQRPAGLHRVVVESRELGFRQRQLRRVGFRRDINETAAVLRRELPLFYSSLMLSISIV